MVTARRKLQALDHQKSYKENHSLQNSWRLLLSFAPHTIHSKLMLISPSGCNFYLNSTTFILCIPWGEFWGVFFTSWTERIENKFLKDGRGMPFVFYLKKITTLLINHYTREDPYFQVQIIYKYLIIKKETKESMLFWRNGSLTFNIIFCQRYYSLRSWRYCLGARLKFWRRSHNRYEDDGWEQRPKTFYADTVHCQSTTI